MPHSSVGKQRLWLTCLGYDVPAQATEEVCRALFEKAGSSGHRNEPPNAKQHRIAEEMGIRFEPGITCYDAAGKLYRVSMLRSWVYSVWRVISGETAERTGQLSLPADEALDLARHMEGAGLFESVQQLPTTEGPETDIFYVMDKPARENKVFQFVAGRLPTLPPSARRAQ